MLIFTLAAAMTLAMLIATAIGLHDEANRVKLENRSCGCFDGIRR